MHFPTGNYLGWTIAYILQVAVCCFYNYRVAMFLLLYISLYFCTNAIANDLMQVVFEINVSAPESLNKNLMKMRAEKTKLLLTTWINLHNDLLKYFFGKFDQQTSLLNFYYSTGSRITFES